VWGIYIACKGKTNQYVWKIEGADQASRTNHGSRCTGSHTAVTLMHVCEAVSNAAVISEQQLVSRLRDHKS